MNACLFTLRRATGTAVPPPLFVRPFLILPLLALPLLVLWGCDSTPSTADASADPSRAAVGASAEPTSTPAATGRTALIWVNGMGCPLCANNVDTQLKKVSGVEDVRINLGTGIVNVRLDESSPPSQAQLEEAIDRTGFSLIRIQMPGGGGA